MLWVNLLKIKKFFLAPKHHGGDNIIYYLSNYSTIKIYLGTQLYIAFSKLNISLVDKRKIHMFPYDSSKAGKTTVMLHNIDKYCDLTHSTLNKQKQENYPPTYTIRLARCGVESSWLQRSVLNRTIHKRAQTDHCHQAIKTGKEISP